MYPFDRYLSAYEACCQANIGKFSCLKGSHASLPSVCVSELNPEQFKASWNVKCHELSLQIQTVT